jgi:hypothetical protein
MKPVATGRYSIGQKRCQVCEIFLRWDGLWCRIPDDAVTGFVVTNITSVLIGILVAMNVYVIRNSKLKLDRSLLSGSILSIASSACASCSSIGFLLISAFGFGIIAADFLTNYQTQLRIVSIAMLLWGLYSVHNKITKACIFNIFRNKEMQSKNTASSGSVETRASNKGSKS